MEEKRFKWGIRAKLTLLFLGVTFVAVFTNFLIVVPRLEAQLRDNQLDEMRRAAAQYGPQLQQYEQFDNQLTAPDYAAGFLATNKLGELAGARVAILKPANDPNLLAPQLQVFADTSGLTTPGSRINDWVARSVIADGKPASGVVDVSGRSHTEAATPIVFSGRTIGVAVFSSSLSNVDLIVKQQARRNLVAGFFALGMSLAVGILVSGFIARRIRRLERAARTVAAGNFTEPLLVDSNDELGHLARAFNNMQERLGRADRARKAFIANASHELRTPLFSLGGYVELLREEDLDPQTQQEFLETMHDQILRLTKLATDLLDLSRIDAGSLEIKPERVDLHELAHAIAREFEPLAQRGESEIDVSAESGLEADCDPDRVGQIIRILVDNALSHTPRGTNVRIAAERRDGSVAVTVGDSGPGIDPEDLPRIFDRFHTGKKTGGTGLGLSIANELAGAMNGRLLVQSQPGQTNFTLELPGGGT